MVGMRATGATANTISYSEEYLKPKYYFRDYFATIAGFDLLPHLNSLYAAPMGGSSRAHK